MLKIISWIGEWAKNVICNIILLALNSYCVLDYYYFDYFEFDTENVQ